MVGLAVGIAFSACSAPAPTPAPTPLTPLPTEALPPLPAEGRPLEPVPEVAPPGFSDPPPGRGLSRYAGQRLDWRVCGTLDCATLLVPLDYRAPDRQAITLTVGRRPAGNGPALGTVLLNPGGPGGSGLDFLRAYEGLDRFDRISWDPRGAGQSTPVRCWDQAQMDALQAVDFSPDDAAEREALIAAQRSFGRSCLEQSGPLLAQVSTAATVRDLDLIRDALGLDTINYLGFSNGSLLGAGYAQLFPDRVGRMVLDGAVNISGSPITQPYGFERALVALADWCAAQRCGLGESREEVLAAVTGLWDRLDAEPMVVGRRQLTQSMAVGAVTQALYFGPPGWAGVSRAVRAATSDGDGTELLAWADRYAERRPDGSYDQFAYAFPASNCADSSTDDLATADAEAAAAVRQAPVMGPHLGPDFLCAVWPVASPPGLPKLTAPDAPQIVVIGTTGDPATPYEWAVGMAGQLATARLVTHRGEGHSSYGDAECVAQVVLPYLSEGRLPAPGAEC